MMQLKENPEEATEFVPLSRRLQAAPLDARPQNEDILAIVLLYCDTQTTPKLFPTALCLKCTVFQ
jgi:hypothetical protein